MRDIRRVGYHTEVFSGFRGRLVHEGHYPLKRPYSAALHMRAPEPPSVPPRRRNQCGCALRGAAGGLPGPKSAVVIPPDRLRQPPTLTALKPLDCMGLGTVASRLLLEG